MIYELSKCASLQFERANFTDSVKAIFEASIILFADKSIELKAEIKLFSTSFKGE